jgi:hypothetical protein
VIEAHRDAPVSHRASRIDTDHAGKCLFRFVVPERVDKGDTVFEGLLCLGSAGDRKVYVPGIMLMNLGIGSAGHGDGH